MFGRKKKAKATPKTEIKLSPKVEKANELRKSANQAGRAMTNIVNKWQKALSDVSSSAERKLIDEKFNQQLSACERVWDKKYSKYYDYVNENFTTSEIVSAGALGKFMDKSFITKLENGRKRK